MAVTTYSELQTAVRSRMGGRSDLSDAQVQEFISLGETELNSVLRLRDMETNTTLSLSASARSIDLPTGFIEDISLRYLNNDYYLTRKSLRDLNRAIDDTETRPDFYAISDKIYFEAPSDAAYSLTFDYFKGFDIANDLTNSLLTNYPKAYLYASLVEYAVYARNEAKEAIWRRQMMQAVGLANRVSGRTRRNAKMITDSVFSGSVGRFDINRGF